MINIDEFDRDKISVLRDERMELYQYEFFCTSEYQNFEEYILKLTGKQKMESIPKEILYLRKSCFTTVEEPNRLNEFLDEGIHDMQILY